MLEFGVVIKVHHKDAETNRSNSYPEYDVLLYGSLLPINNVSAMGLKVNDDSGDEITLTAASEPPDMSNPESIAQNFFESDGDLVLVMNVLEYAPVIMGTIPHFKSDSDTASWHGEAADGERRGMHHKGSSLVLKDDSNVDLNLPDDKEMTININGTQLFRVHNNGGSLTLELGAGGDALVLGDSFQTWWDNNVAGHDHGPGSFATVSGPVTGLSGTAVPTLPNSVLSDVSSTE